MPEEKAKYTIPCSRCDGTGLVDRTARGAKTCPDCGGRGKVQETEPELMICPLRMMPVSERIFVVTCLKDECAWWREDIEMCAVPAIPDALMGLYEALDEIRDKTR